MVSSLSFMWYKRVPYQWYWSLSACTTPMYLVITTICVPRYNERLSYRLDWFFGERTKIHDSDVQSGCTIVISALITPKYVTVISFATPGAGGTEQKQDYDRFWSHLKWKETRQVWKDNQTISLRIFRWLCVQYVSEKVQISIMQGDCKMRSCNSMVQNIQNVADFPMIL